MSDDFLILDPRFSDLLAADAKIEKLYEGCGWAEGPVWFGDQDVLIWSDIPNNRMLRWSADSGVDTFRHDTQKSNGNFRDRQGRLVTCLHDGRKVVRTEYDGSTTVIADSYQGKRLNSPNDVVVTSDGAIWFTDPNYGLMNNDGEIVIDQEQAGCFVFRVSADLSEITSMVEDFVKPNGLAFSADEKTLYIADSGFSNDPDAPHHIRAFDLDADGNLTNDRIFADITPGLPDGFRFDTAGNLWTSAKDGVQCFAPDGTLIGKILLPEVCANLTFGGPDKNRIFMTANTSLYVVDVAISGIQTP
ncbi:MAG: SMP-30/gluconolactonase/LRE family protein [Rhodobacteraceae bacterium]|nr:SMP-30/gluconolactonase/LRE family protein [Paracoccaceae bacterium]